MIDRVMVESCPDASHVLAISELSLGERRKIVVSYWRLCGGMCGGEVCPRRV